MSHRGLLHSSSKDLFHIVIEKHQRHGSYDRRGAEDSTEAILGRDTLGVQRRRAIEWYARGVGNLGSDQALQRMLLWEPMLLRNDVNNETWSERALFRVFLP